MIHQSSDGSEQLFCVEELFLSLFFLQGAFFWQSPAIIHPDGNFVWVKSFGSDLTEKSTGLSKSGDGGLYLSGWFDGAIDLDPSPGSMIVTPIHPGEIFVLKLDSNGDLVWAKPILGQGYNFSTQQTTNSYNGVYITGLYQDTLDLDPDIGVQNAICEGDREYFILYLDPDGNFQWKGTFGTSDDPMLGSCVVRSITVDTKGNLYLSGDMSDTIDFDPNSGVYEVPNTGSSNGFLFKIAAANAGITELKGGGIKLFPSPASQSLNIKSEKLNLDRIVIYDIQGLQVNDIEQNGQNATIDVSTLIQGTYIIEVHSEGLITRKKFIKK